MMINISVSNISVKLIEICFTSQQLPLHSHDGMVL